VCAWTFERERSVAFEGIVASRVPAFPRPRVPASRLPRPSTSGGIESSNQVIDDRCLQQLKKRRKIVLRSKTSFLSVVAGALVVVFVPVLALGGELPADQTAGSPDSTVLSASAEAGSAPAESALVVSDQPDSENAFCPAESPQTIMPDQLEQFAFGRKTCKCSCGYPCKTDADCGPGGICATGITCC